MNRSREVPPEHIIEIRNKLVKRFRFLNRTRAESIGMPRKEFRDWIDELVGEGIALAMNQRDEWDEQKGDLLCWAFLKTRYLIRRDFVRMKRQTKTDQAFGEIQESRQQTDRNLSRQSRIQQQLFEIFEDLTDKQGKALILHHLLGYSVKEIQTLTGQPEQTLYSLIRRGRKRAHRNHPDWSRRPRQKANPLTPNQNGTEDTA